MSSNYGSRPTSQYQNGQMQLCQELTRLNSSLKLQLQKCHQYIDTLEKDLHQVEQRSNYSMMSQNMNVFSENIEQQNNQLKQEVQRLGLKLKQKRLIVKKLQKHCQGLEVYLHQSLREKEQLEKSLSRLQYLLETKNNQQRQNMKRLEMIIKEQKETIIFYNRQLQGKATGSQKMFNRMQEIQTQRISLIKQNQQTRQINLNLSHHLKQLERKHQQRQFKLTTELRQTQNKNIDLINQINKLSLSSSRLGMTAMVDPHLKSYSSKRVVTEQMSLRQMQYQNTRLNEQIKTLQEEKNKERDKFEWLKNDIISMKLENTSLANQNRFLNQQKTVLLNRSQSSNYYKPNISSVSNLHNTEYSYQINSLNSIKSCNKTVATLESANTKRYSITPQDGQIPVHDKSNMMKKSSIISSTNPIDPKKSAIFHRQNIVNFTTSR